MALIILEAELLILPKIASRIIVPVCPTDPKNISLRLPTLSIRNIAIKDAIKYSVALQAAIIRDFVSDICNRSKSKVYCRI
jgi:hypothetical protein